MTEIEAIILDSETTGFRAPQPIEVGYLSLQALQNYEGVTLLSEAHPEFCERYKPTKAIDPGAVAVHGIRLADLLDKPRFSVEALTIPETTQYIVAHNISYDWRVLGKPASLGLKRICTIKLAKALWPGLDSYKLTALIGEFFPEGHAQLVANAHGALIDTKLCLGLIAKARQEFELETWADIYEIAGQG